LDYDHYLDAQLLPVALSIAAACGWKAEGLLRKGAARGNAARGYADAGQMDLFPMG
jgi:DNA polymerase elongation subunit (family B)